MKLYLLIVLLCITAYAAMPQFPDAYSCEIITNGQSSSGTQLYIDYTNNRTRSDFNSGNLALENIIKLINSQWTLCIVAPSASYCKCANTTKPIPPGTNCNTPVYIGVAIIRGIICQQWNAVCTNGNISYYWNNSVPVEIVSNGVIIDYYNFTSGTPNSTLFTLPQYCVN